MRHAQTVTFWLLLSAYMGLVLVGVGLVVMLFQRESTAAATSMALVVVVLLAGGSLLLYGLPRQEGGAVPPDRAGVPS